MTQNEAKIETGAMSEEEAAEAFGGDPEPKEELPLDGVPVDGGELPNWANQLPVSLKVPEDTQVAWIRIRADMTIRPNGGDRVLVLWPLNEVEEKQAIARARGGDQHALIAELSKACIRMIDGIPTDRTGSMLVPGSLSKTWRDIGPKGRALVRTYYQRVHTLTMEESTDFFLNCFVTKIAAAG